MRLKKRGGGVPPIVTVITIIAFIAAATLVGWYIMSTTSIATRRPILSIQGTPTIINGKLYLTIRNDGTANAYVSEVALKGLTVSNCNLGSIPKDGGVRNITCSVTGAVNGKTYEGVVKTSAGDLKFRATAE